MTSTTTPSIVYIDNTNTLELQGLKSVVEDVYINDADVSVTIKESAADGDDLAGATWPMPMDYVTASDGNYRISLSHLLPFGPRKTYVAVIDADGGVTPSERFGHWEFEFVANVRTG